jgi:hypothetical protein
LRAVALRCVAPFPVALLAVAMPALSGAARAQETRPGYADFLEGRRQTDAGGDGRAAFRRALEALLNEARTQPEAPERYLNLGNAALLADDLPRSIWAFRKGLALAPQHARLREHLQYARAQVTRLPARGEPEDDPWPWWLPRWRSAVWLAVLLAGYALVCGAFTVWRVQGGGGWLVCLAAALIVAGVAAFAWHGGWSERRRDRETPVVVVVRETGLHTGNGPSYPRHPELPVCAPGVEARRLRQRGGWLQVQSPAGDVGWLRGADVFVVDEP